MDAQTPDTELSEVFTKELAERYAAGEMFHFEINVPQAFSLIAALQLALRHPDIEQSGKAVTMVRDFAICLEEFLSTSPAFKEVCRRGWLPKYDVKTQ